MILPNVTIPRVPLLREAGDVLGQVQIGYQRIDSFHKLVVDQLPYGQIDPANLVQGLIELDGPDQDDPPIDKVPLQWYFGGQAYEVRKAIRIQYAYQKYLDSGPVNASGSLFIGYAPATTGAASVAERALAALQDLIESDDKAAARQTAHTLRGQLDGVRQQAGRVQAAVRARREATDWDSLKTLPGTVTDLAMYVDTQQFDDFIYTNIPGLAPAAAAPPRLAEVFVPVARRANSVVQVYYDGPAADYNSHKAFPYTTDTLFNDQEKYNQVLWWYFGGRAYRITKAMLLDYDAGAGASGILLVGYQGPGPA